MSLLEIEIEVLKAIERYNLGVPWRSTGETVWLGDLELKAQDWRVISKELERRGLIYGVRSRVFEGEELKPQQQTIKAYWISAAGYDFLKELGY